MKMNVFRDRLDKNISLNDGMVVVDHVVGGAMSGACQAIAVPSG